MAALLKDLYSESFYNRFSNVLLQTLPSFDKQAFIQQVFDVGFEGREYKARMKHTTRVLHQFFPVDYAVSVMLIEMIIIKLREEGFGENGIAFMFFPDYIETYGLDEFDTSVKAFEYITQFVSCEFAVRPFIIKYGAKMLKRMEVWALHANDKVRRLSSEGSRPRLPWAMAIPALKKDPNPILTILEQLKNDPSESVRRSVANNLNDIAKDNPSIVLQTAARWKGTSKQTDAIIKHGSRTLLKQGHLEILKHFGLDSEYVETADFKILTPEIRIGDDVSFSFSVTNKYAEPKTVRLEYAIYFKRQNGLVSKKVFKISERIFRPGEKVDITRKQSFKIITTRRFYPGKHSLSIIINGTEKGTGSFELKL